MREPISKRVDAGAIVTVMACCLFATFVASAQNSKPAASADVAKLVALERMWNQAQLVRDSTAVASMIGDKFVNTEYDGEVSDRGKFLADFADPEYRPTIMNIDDIRVDFYTNTAVVTGTYHTKGTCGSKPYDHFGRFTDTWVFHDGKWLCVASHTSLLKK